MSFDETDARSDYKMSIGDEEKEKKKQLYLEQKSLIYVSYTFHICFIIDTLG